MALIFPSNPTVNQTYQSGSSAQYLFDGQKWIISAPTAITVVNATSASFATSASNAATASFIPTFEWVDGGAITIGAVTTAPTKGTTVYDDVRYRRVNSTTWELEYNYAQSNTGGAGSGIYLWSLPSGVTWGAGVLTTTSDTVNTYINRSLITKGQVFSGTGTQQRLLAVIPYDSTRFRLIASDGTGQFSQVGSAYYALSNSGISFKFSFYTTA